MTFIFPIAGLGTRTSSLGNYKPLIKIKDKSILEWSLSNLPINSSDISIFILPCNVSNEDYTEVYNIASLYCNKFLLHQLDYDTIGPIHSIKSILPLISDNASKVLIINTDQIIKFNMPSYDNFVTVYYNDSSESCYFMINDNKVINIKEKQMISNYASSGVYCFSTSELLNNSINWGVNTYGLNELTVGTCMNYLLNNNIPIYPVKTDIKIDLGTIDNINKFKNYSL